MPLEAEPLTFGAERGSAIREQHLKEGVPSISNRFLAFKNVSG